MSGNVKQGVLLVVGAAALTFAIVQLISFAQASDGEGVVEQTALCTSCGHYYKTTLEELAKRMPPGGMRPAISPEFGPGYECPECGKPTMYPNPIKCEECGTLFLVSRSESGAVIRCPKCNWER